MSKLLNLSDMFKHGRNDTGIVTSHPITIIFKFETELKSS